VVSLKQRLLCRIIRNPYSKCPCNKHPYSKQQDLSSAPTAALPLTVESSAKAAEQPFKLKTDSAYETKVAEYHQRKGV
jgi:hypothetical protein